MIESSKVLAAIKESDERSKEHLSLLATRRIVLEALKSAPAELGCEQILERCIALLTEWDGQRGPQEPPLVGCIHLLAELLRSRADRDGMCNPCSCLTRAEAEDSQHSYVQLLKTLLHFAQGNTATAIFGHEVSPLKPSEWGTRLQSWDRWLIGSRKSDERRKEKPPARTEVGQALIMHLLELALADYNKTPEPLGRGTLNLLLVPLLRAVYSQPDRAHLAYRRYWIGENTEQPTDPFHALYWYDLGILENLQSRGIARRSEVLGALREYFRSRDEGVLKTKINDVLHGSSVEPRESPSPKMTRVSQLSCLVREINADKNSEQGSGGSKRNRRYALHLSHVDYRSILENSLQEAPAKLKWPRSDPRRKQRFTDCVALAYEAGYDVSFLGALFENAGAGQLGLPVWIQDGEITFLWLLAAVRTALLQESDRWASWLEESQGQELFLSKSDVIGRSISQDDSRYLALGSTLTQFATTHAGLFAEDGSCRPKAWAFFNFLQRAAISKRPAQYGEGDGPLARITGRMYALALENAELSVAWLRACLRDEAVAAALAEIKDLIELKAASRLPTFLLEVLLRDGDPAPYSLFFYPISFEASAESYGGEVLPTAFLAGTFGALEWSCFPSVTERQNYHLFSVLDAVRPLVDHELGAVFAKDEQGFREQIRAVDRARVASAVVPAARRLAELFRQARGQILQIEAAVNPDWGGLFGEMPAVNLAPIFESASDVRISRHKAGEPEAVRTTHAPDRGPQEKESHWSRLDQLMVYLARDVVGYEGDDLWDVATQRIRWATGPAPGLALAPGQASRPFERQPFLDALHEIVAGRSVQVEPADLLLLIKLLTVDPADPNRGVHIVQVAAALGTLNKAECEVRVAESQPIMGTFCPREYDGIVGLVRVIAALIPKAMRGAVGTRDLTGWAQLSQGREQIAALQVLRALAVLASDAMNRNRERLVRVQRWEIEQLDTRGFEVRLLCDNWFPPEVKLALADEHAIGETYHDLRTNMASLSRASGAPPSFVRSGSKTHPPDDDNRFVVSEWIGEGARKSTISLRFLLREHEVNYR